MNSKKLMKTRLVKSVTLCDNEENRWHWKTSIQHRFISLSYINEKNVLRTVWIFMSVLKIPLSHYKHRCCGFIQPSFTLRQFVSIPWNQLIISWKDNVHENSEKVRKKEICPHLNLADCEQLKLARPLWLIALESIWLTCPDGN